MKRMVFWNLDKALLVLALKMLLAHDLLPWIRWPDYKCFLENVTDVNFGNFG